MQDKTQDEKPVHYEQKPDKDKPDYTLQRTYEPQSTGGEQISDRRGFLKRAGTAVVVGLGGILFGKKALADGIDGIVGEEGGLKKVTGDYDKIRTDNSEGAYNCCTPACQPSCDPYECSPDCNPKIQCLPNCTPKLCNPYCTPPTPCVPNCTPPDEPCDPNCTP